MALREVRLEDLPIFYEHQRDAEANRMAAFPPRDWQAFVEHWRDKVLGDTSARKRTIVFGDHVAGNILSWQHEGRRLIGYWLGREYWNRGLATAALAEFLTEEKTRPLFAYVAVGNFASIRVLEKCGFCKVHAATAADGVEEYLFRLDG